MSNNPPEGNKPAPFEVLRHAKAAGMQFRLIKVWTGHYVIQAFRESEAYPSYNKKYRSERNAIKRYEHMCGIYGAKQSPVGAGEKGRL